MSAWHFVVRSVSVMGKEKKSSLPLFSRQHVMLQKFRKRKKKTSFALEEWVFMMTLKLALAGALQSQPRSLASLATTLCHATTNYLVGKTPSTRTYRPLVTCVRLSETRSLTHYWWVLNEFRSLFQNKRVSRKLLSKVLKIHSLTFLENHCYSCQNLAMTIDSFCPKIVHENERSEICSLTKFERAHNL